MTIIRQYSYHIRRWTLLAMLPALLIGALTYLYTARKPKTYQATAILYVQQSANLTGSAGGGTDVQTSQAVVPTYTQMITDPVLAPAVDRIMEQRYPGYHLEAHGGARASQSPGTSTQLISVSVSDTDPGRAAAATNAVARAFINKVTRIELSRFGDDQRALDRQVAGAQAEVARVTQQIDGYQGDPTGLASLKATLAADQNTYRSLLTSSLQFKATRDALRNGVSVYSPATVPSTPTGPHPARSALLAAFVALLLCAGGLYVYDYLDDSPRTPEEIEAMAGAPILGAVERFDTRRLGSELVTVEEPRSPASEAYRLIRTNIQFTNVDKPPRTLLITSPSSKEGKSTTAGNLAQVLAQGGQMVTLVDGDLRRPSLHRIFGLAGPREGLTSLLANSHLNGHGVRQPEQPNLSVVAAGPVPPNPADLLGSRRMQSVLAHLREHAHVVLLDSPPVLAVADAAILSASVDGVVMVVDSKKTKRRDIQKAREAIEGVGGTILGVVINRLNRRGSLDYYYSHYGYHYESGDQGASSS